MTPRLARLRPMLAAAVVVLAVVFAVVAVMTSRGGTARTSPDAEGTARPSPPGAAAPQIPRISLADLRWTAFHGIELPVSGSAGPRDTAGAEASGYAESPLGALVAAVNIAVRANGQWGPPVFGPAIRNQVTGPYAADLLAACTGDYQQASQSAQVAGGQPIGRGYAVEEAFRWVFYTPSAAAVDLVSAGPGPDGVTARAVTHIELLWLRGDWRVVAPPGGDWGNAAQQLASLAGYTTFPGKG